MEPEAPAQDVAVAAKRAELSAEVERARGWILAVGVMIYAFDMFQIWAGQKPLATLEALRGLRYRVTLGDGVVLLLFVLLWWFAQRRPRLCCVIALLLYWGLQIGAAVIAGDGAMVFKGIPVKVFFTLALLRAIKSATNAAKIRTDLAQVFS